MNFTKVVGLIEEKNSKISLLIRLTKQMESIIIVGELDSFPFLLSQRENAMGSVDLISADIKEALGDFLQKDYPEDVVKALERGRILGEELFTVDKSLRDKVSESMKSYKEEMKLLKEDMKYGKAYGQYGGVTSGARFDSRR